MNAEEPMVSLNETLFNCERCKLGYDDLIGLKAHYNELHSKNYVDPYIENDSPNKTKKEEASKVNKKSEKEQSRRQSIRVSSKRKLSEVPSEESAILSTPKQLKTTPRANKREETPLDEYKDELDEKKIKQMEIDELEAFNLASIDETPYFEYSNKCKTKRLRDIVAGRVAWAKWKHTMWPAMIERVNKDKKDNLRISIRYYEMNRKLGNVFFLDSSKVELFFKCEQHVDFKRLACVNQNQRKEFFVSYTNALKDYIKYNLDEDLKQQQQQQQNDANTTIDSQLEEADNINKTQESELTKTDECSYTNKSLSKSSRSRSKATPQKTINVYGKWLTVNEIKTLATQPYSEAQLHENQIRKENSFKLLDLVKSKECKDFILDIFSSNSINERHINYLKAESNNKRKKSLKNEHVGPLVSEHQIEIGCYLTKLSAEFYKDKPESLTNYEHDVLYPEAVIWAIRELYEISYNQAETRFKKGFIQTNEEINKKRCIEILNNLNIKIDDIKENIQNKDSISANEEYNENELNEDNSFFLYENTSQVIDDKNDDELPDIEPRNENMEIGETEKEIEQSTPTEPINDKNINSTNYSEQSILSLDKKESNEGADKPGDAEIVSQESINKEYKAEEKVLFSSVMSAKETEKMEIETNIDVRNEKECPIENKVPSEEQKDKPEVDTKSETNP